MKATYYPPNSRVVVSLPDDWHNGQRGIVASTRSVGGYMEQRVRFSDGATAADYAGSWLALKHPVRKQGGGDIFEHGSEAALRPVHRVA